MHSEFFLCWVNKKSQFVEVGNGTTSSARIRWPWRNVGGGEYVHTPSSVHINWGHQENDDDAAGSKPARSTTLQGLLNCQREKSPLPPRTKWTKPSSAATSTPSVTSSVMFAEQGWGRSAHLGTCRHINSGCEEVCHFG